MNSKSHKPKGGGKKPHGKYIRNDCSRLKGIYRGKTKGMLQNR